MFGEAFLPNVLTSAVAGTLTYATLMDAGLLREAPQIAPKVEQRSGLERAEDPEIQWR
jgi:hypothetical protein